MTPLLFAASAAMLVLNTMRERPTQALAGLGVVLLGTPVFYLWRARNGAAPSGVGHFQSTGGLRMHTLVDQHLRRRWLILACSIMTLGGLAASPSVAASQGTSNGTIVGRVTDARTGSGIQNATVQVEATRLAGTTNTDGRFRIANVPAGAHNVVVLRLGFASAHRAVTVVAGQDISVDVGLQVSAVELDQVVVTGTAGGEARRAIGNVVARIDAGDELAKSAATNLSSLLNARAPGLSIQNTTGSLGAGPAIQIRGRSSLALATRR